MGTFRVEIEIGDPAGGRWESVEALVDTGATYTTVPASVLGRLGVTPHVRDVFEMADGRRVEHDIGRGWVRVSGRAEVTLVVFGEPAAPLLGAYTLEGLRLAPDPSAAVSFPSPHCSWSSYSPLPPVGPVGCLRVHCPVGRSS